MKMKIQIGFVWAVVAAAMFVLCASAALGGEVFEDAANQPSAKTAAGQPLDSQSEPWEDAADQPQSAQTPGQETRSQQTPAGWVGRAPKADPAMRPAQPQSETGPVFSEAPGKKAEREKRRNARLAFTRGIDLFNAGDYEQAFQMFLDFLAVFPEDPQGQQYLNLTQEMLAGQKEGTLQVASSPPAEVYLDGRLQGHTPLTLGQVPVGPHRVEVRSGSSKQTSTIIVRGRITTSVEFDLTRQEEPPPPDWYKHSGLGFLLKPPVGWQLEENARGGKTALRLTTPDKNSMIQVDVKDVEGDPPDVEAFAQKWEQAFLASDTLIRERLDWRWQDMNGRRFLVADYGGDDIAVRMFFLARPGRIYFISGITTPAQKAMCFGELDRLVLSFQPQ